VLQRVLEAKGLSTVSISLVREHTEKLRPPRALFVPFPFGSPFGAAGDAAQQHRVLRAALDLLDASGPVLRDLEGEDDPSLRASPLQAAAVDRGPYGDVADEVTAMRRYHEEWVRREGRTTVGVTGIPAVRFRGVVRFLTAYADGRDAGHPARPADVPVEMFVRWCADDLKAMYLEARLLTAPPGETPEDTARWLWGETALGSLLRDVAERMAASDDPALKRIALGIAR
jgi:hypothetical protein